MVKLFCFEQACFTGLGKRDVDFPDHAAMHMSVSHTPHHQYLVGLHQHLIQLVGHKDDCGRLPRTIPIKCGPSLLSRSHVERTERLVQNQKVRLRNHCTQQTDQLLLSAALLVWVGLQVYHQAHLIKKGVTFSMRSLRPMPCTTKG